MVIGDASAPTPQKNLLNFSGIPTAPYLDMTVLNHSSSRTEGPRRAIANSEGLEGSPRIVLLINRADTLLHRIVKGRNEILVALVVEV